ncbi:metallophosphoesterase family protein [Rhodopila sp.]|jgi:serine/threonine protein phosphatase 1|uniref:metallophosphoesterase family protein n=1 Tax=Rhodopila sp. TaxID=2480087 RepID=UPI002C95495B|nr:metallophosphoesterase family protein [Rhodopila sp.]HVZ08169.1 metallophosphoesterase family protein [Rhodopila sp.]
MTDFLPAPAALPAGQRIYAIGDIHGCVDRLVAMHEAIAEDMDERPCDDVTLVHLGDYIDRGTDSAQVVDWLLAGPPVPASRIVNLMGNHEDMMLAALDGTPEAASQWLANGGADSLMSWGIPRSVAPAEWGARIPEHHQAFLRTLDLRLMVPPYLFVHAGIRPGLPLQRQTKQDMLWIREPFLSSGADHGFVVVHGHTPKREPIVLRNRIAIDTGAVLGGALTCAVLEEDRLGFIQT